MNFKRKVLKLLEDNQKFLIDNWVSQQYVTEKANSDALSKLELLQLLQDEIVEMGDPEDE